VCEFVEFDWDAAFEFWVDELFAGAETAHWGACSSGFV
jgi:hypothetical protein